jgi:serine/threonine protein kinase
MTPERWNLITAIFHAAVARDTDARGAFLAEACHGDPMLRADVEAMLAAHHAVPAEFGNGPGDSRAGEEPPLAPGTAIGVYRIESLLGGGGQARVYRARDTQIGKPVAIKVLPAGWLDDPDRRARFEREARVLAALNHAHIATIHGLVEADGRRGLVLELVDGTTLAERVDRGPLPVVEALRLAGQIALALECAHERGIIHRDLKPANIKITTDGAVKVLDFGLAKLTGGDGPPLSEPALSLAGTREGLVAGTPAYMSPEQARGKPVDKRTDVWAFGCVLYEMLAGRAAFEGETITDTLAAVLEHEPNWSLLPAATPEAIRRLVRRCLEKDPARRLRDIGDARLETEDALAAARSTPASADRSQPSGSPLYGRLPLAPGAGVRWGRWVTVASVTILGGAAAAWWWWPILPAAPTRPPVMRLNVDLGPEVSLGSQTGPEVGLSPDGERLVFISKGRLFARRLDQSASVAVDGTEGATSFFFSPDSNSVAFFTQDKLKRVALDVGSVGTICDAPAGRGGSWGEDGVIVAALTGFDGLVRVPAAGGPPEPLTRLAPGEVTHRWPQLLPGGNAVLFTSHTSTAMFDRARIELLTLADGRRRTLQENASFGRFMPASGETGYPGLFSSGLRHCCCVRSRSTRVAWIAVHCARVRLPQPVWWVRHLRCLEYGDACVPDPRTGDRELAGALGLQPAVGCTAWIL